MAGIIDAADYQGRFVWYELAVRDVAALRTFYSKVMGWGVQDASMPGMSYTFFTIRNAFVSGLMGLPNTVPSVGWLGYVAVADVDAAIERVVRLGGTVHAPPTDVVGVSRFAIVADPQGAPFAVLTWLKPRARPLADAQDAGQVGWHELYVPDCERAFAFYGQLFGWRRPDDDDSDGAYRRFAAGGDTIGGVFEKPPLVPVPHWLYYVNVADIAAAAGRVAAAGGKVLEGPLEVPGGVFFLRCTDPEGTPFALRGPRRREVGYFPRAPRPQAPR